MKLPLRNISWFTVPTATVIIKQVRARPVVQDGIQFFLHRRGSKTVVTHHRTGRIAYVGKSQKEVLESLPGHVAYHKADYARFEAEPSINV